jgi:creatinine amidohydrolase
MTVVFMRPIFAAFTALLFSVTVHAAPATAFIEDMTWVEVRDAQRAGKTTIIIPVGGIEQNGPHMALGKHNVRVHVLAGRIATALGNALVAPVLAYVPEGNITPPTAHMRFTGTISITDEAFKSLLDSAARSFKQHGFTDVVLIGDHGGYQSQLKAVAAKLNKDWAGAAGAAGAQTRAHFISDYYQATQTTYVKALRAQGLSDAQIGTHAGTADTALLMAIDPNGVRGDLFATSAREGVSTGTAGDPRAATAALGQLGVDAVVTESVAAIKAAVGKR